MPQEMENESLAREDGEKFTDGDLNLMRLEGDAFQEMIDKQIELNAEVAAAEAANPEVAEFASLLRQNKGGQIRCKFSVK